MAGSRKEVVFEGVEMVYHCVSRCVRRALLCGNDPYDGRSYEHRKGWVRNRLEKLANIFGIEILAYAVMSNHLHIVMRTRPDWVESWGAEETARRWLTLFSNMRNKQGKPSGASVQEIRLLAGRTERVEELRRRLGSISWFMRCLNENIARRANHEDGCKGRFWEGRFYCQALLDEGAVLYCMAYVDLNPIRAGLVMTPEDSEFTSIFERIHRRNCGWLCPIGEEGPPDRPGALSLTREEYLILVDWTGRQVRSDKRGAIPEHLKPLLERLDVRPQRWVRTVDGFGGLFHRVAGKVESIRKAARLAGKRWLAGATAGRRAFASDPATE